MPNTSHRRIQDKISFLSSLYSKFRIRYFNLRGFTLIELMVAISIVAILATIGIVAFGATQSSARDTKRRGDVEDIKKAMYLYRAGSGTFCPRGMGLCSSPWYKYACYAYYNGTALPDGDCSGPPTSSSGFLKDSLKSYPVDPKYSSSSPVSWATYAIRITGDDTFEVHARLEKAPSSTGCTLASPEPNDYNYCVTQ